MRVMDREATINPSAVEEKARKAMAQRQDAHEKANQERKLTPEERRAKKRKKLQENTDLNFFREWWHDRPELTEAEKQSLDQLKADFHYLSKYAMSEEAVKLVMVSPLLAMAGFYRAPFRLTVV